MSEPKVRHGLESYLSKQDQAPEMPGIQIQILGDRGHINLRGNPENETFLSVAGQILGQALPATPNTMTIGEHHVYWLGPDEWLIVSEQVKTDALFLELKATLRPFHSAVTNLSGGQIALHVEGVEVRRLLAKGCTLDFHPREFKVLDCAQSGIAKTSVLIGRLEETDSFELVVRRSFEEYLLMWLTHSGKEFGVTID